MTRCISCQKSTKGFKLYCGHCGAPIETSSGPKGDQSSEHRKPKKSFPRKTLIIIATSVIFIAATGTILSFVLGQAELSVKAKVSFPKESSLWLDEPYEIRGLVQSSNEMPKGFSYELLDKTGKKIKLGSITPGTKSFRFTAAITRMGNSAQYTLRVLDESGEIKFSTKSPLMQAVTTSLPSSCNLPQLESAYGSLDERRQGTDYSGVFEMGTFFCEGHTVGGMGPQVHYYDQSFYEPDRNRYKDWLDQVDYQLTSPPYSYIQTTLNNYQVLYDCYIPNVGDPQVMAALINVHGVEIDYWNEGCLDSNTKYILEAASNVPVHSLK